MRNMSKIHALIPATEPVFDCWGLYQCGSDIDGHGCYTELFVLLSSLPLAEAVVEAAEDDHGTFEIKKTHATAANITQTIEEALVILDDRFISRR